MATSELGIKLTVAGAKSSQDEVQGVAAAVKDLGKATAEAANITTGIDAAIDVARSAGGYTDDV